MKSAIIVFPGTNREKDMQMALAHISGHTPRLVWHKETSLPDCDLMVLPGGFSYGDYLRCGAMAAHSPIMREVIDRAKKGTRLLAVCNGFQMLVETGLVPGALLRNRSLKFICKQIYLRSDNTSSDFTHRFAKGQVSQVPIAHGEGNYFINEDGIKSLQDHDQIAFRYCNKDGLVCDEANPNGSIANIAGVLNTEKTILGMMPHPEDSVMPQINGHQGIPLFQSIVEALA
ncbi:MAG: phosphoribosylformylglycinamidine synthase subunit PurQ [Alphaproteobacteria bacterium]|nr:phosphoribosylformylglycinamidine synthase subunit PurQ [Alphaproteobacteria bacterium]MCB1551396.1 phosphoribosylformylglycinamidine synthase subunit PurQ [Alphaproteobacteria bacterium]MCB9984287.1 phosphoribosylformylglycinamidine synthase subunit PurQ [Micavibrio sp.]